MRTVIVCVTRFTAARPVRSVTVFTDSVRERSANVNLNTQVSQIGAQVSQWQIQRGMSESNSIRLTLLLQEIRINWLQK